VIRSLDAVLALVAVLAAVVLARDPAVNVIAARCAKVQRSGKHKKQGCADRDQRASGYKRHWPPSQFRCHRDDGARPVFAAEDTRIGESVRRSRAVAELCKAPLSVLMFPGHPMHPLCPA
jgi:hypothetical protein